MSAVVRDLPPSRRLLGAAHKGRQVCVEGRLRTRKWQDKDGNDKYSTEVVADQVTFLGPQRPAVQGEALEGAA